MNRNRAITSNTRPAPSVVISLFRRLMLPSALVLLSGIAAFPQSSELQEKLAAVKQAAAENKQRLQQYQWIETTQLTLKGDQKPPTQNLCQYGPDGQVQKTPIGPPPQQ